jgi:multiple sugar transport system permease protein
MSADRLFWRSLRVTATYAAMRVPAGIVFGLGLALILNHGAIRLKSAFRVLYYLPAVLPPVAVSLMWTWIFAQDGILNNALAVFGVKGLLWINDERLVLPSFLMMAIWSLMGKNMLVYLAGLNSIPVQLVESASIDGASGWKAFWRIKLPLLTPILFYEIVMTLIESFKIFTQAYVMTRGGPRNASLFYVYHLYKNAFEYYQMGYASALAWVLFVLVMLLTLGVFRSSNRWVHYEGGR